MQKFLVLALKANPNVLECLYSPLVEKTTPLGDELLAMRATFLSRLVYQTYRNRLLISGISGLREGFVPVRVESHRDELLTIRRGDMPWEETEKWRLALHREFDAALKQSELPDRPDYGKANDFLIRARRAALSEGLP